MTNVDKHLSDRPDTREVGLLWKFTFLWKLSWESSERSLVGVGCVNL
jgi:hypothetical protein